MKTFTQGKRDKRGFSLVEILLAMGVFVTFMLPLIAILSFGIQDFSKSLSKTVESQITQQLYAELQQSPYGDLAVAGRILNRIRYFDHEGNEVSANDPFIFSSFILEADRPKVAIPNSRLGVATDATTMVSIVVAKNLDLGQLEMTSGNLLKIRPEWITITPVAVSNSGH
jgi:uncharacterized protein (TIGR02598 family)